MTKHLLSVLLTTALATAGCGSDDGSLDDARPAIAAYATNVRAAYGEALAKAKELRTAVDAFVAAPSATTLATARTAWLAAREPYGQTEVFRFYDGPIDNPDDGPEGLINGWPLDEVYIDYVAGMPNAGIVNDTSGMPTITKEALAAKNEQGGEKNLSTGYHAIEFLLWGQDTSATGPGDRPFTDYTTATNATRRGQYLKLVTELLVDDLQQVVDGWATTGDTYNADFLAADPEEAVRRILTGMGSLGGAELSGERMTTAYDNMDQEDEHSCFSDNTLRDLYLNALGIQNVYLGKYGATDGAGLDDVVKARDEALDTKMKTQLADSLAKITAIQGPFDQAIKSSTERPKILAAIRALQDQTETVVDIATLLGIQLNLE